MLRLLVDENFNHDLVRGVLRRQVVLDLARVQDVGLGGTDDSTVLAWAAQERRVLLTHDINTIPHHAYERVRRGEPMTGVFVVPQHAAPGQVIENIVLLATCSEPDEWVDRILYLPLR